MKEQLTISDYKIPVYVYVTNTKLIFCNKEYEMLFFSQLSTVHLYIFLDI